MCQAGAVKGGLASGNWGTSSPEFGVQISFQGGFNQEGFNQEERMAKIDKGAFCRKFILTAK